MGRDPSIDVAEDGEDGQNIISPKSQNILGKLKAKKSSSGGIFDAAAEVMSNKQHGENAGNHEQNGDLEGSGEINRDTFTLFTPAPGAAQAVQASWKMFLGKYSSNEAVGEAIFQALFEAAPSLQSLFTSSRAVQGAKFVIAVQELVASMSKPEELQAFVETLGFLHLHFDMTSARVAIFRDAIMDVMAFELGSGLTEESSKGFISLLNYVGGGLIYVRNNFAERLRIIDESWTYVNDKSAQERTMLNQGEDSDSEGSGEDQNAKQAHQQQQAQQGQGKSRLARARNLLKRRKDHHSGGPGAHGKEGDGTVDKKEAQQKVEQYARTFPEMFSINCAVMGMQVAEWMTEILEQFDVLVSNVASSQRLKEESDVLALRLSKHEKNVVNLKEFKSCMLAALRSLLPKQWTSAHEAAWSWMWDNVARMLTATMGNPPKYEAGLGSWLETMDEAALYEMRKLIYAKFFDYAPAGQYYFKQSNTRLHFIAERITSMSLEIYQQPKKMVQDISALGLRHVEFGIPTDLFAPFVQAAVEVVGTLTDSNDATDAFRWSLGLISRILVRTIKEGSTLVMKAINANSILQMKKAIDTAPRCERADWLLQIKVGQQSISPLSWSIESGALDVAREIIKDLLTIRADRQSYYFGAEALFKRHPDIVRRLVEDSPMLLPPLLDGIIWRSHRPDNGMRRVNYFVKYLMVNQQGKFADALKWLAATGDPSIIAHPVVSYLSDMLWSGVIFRQFIVQKMWNVFSLIVFMLSQGVLPRMITVDIEDSERQMLNIFIFAGRTFLYVLGMGRLAMFHLARIWYWCRTTMKTIFDEIDQDGSGSIDWEEFKEAIGMFKKRVKDEFYKVFKFLKDDDGPAQIDDGRKSISNQSKSTYNTISFILMIIIALMLTHEPILFCTGEETWPTEVCPDSQKTMYRYSILSMIALVIHWLILVDLAVFSTEISAFILVCGHVMAEVQTFLTALTYLLLMFGSALPIFCSSCPVVAGKFSTMPEAILSLFAITLGWFEADDVMDIRESNRVLLIVLTLFVGASVILLLNLLIAQLNRSYEYIYQDMIGFAKLNRASLIVEAMNSVSKKKWQTFLDEANLDQKVEFDPGDLGLPGAVQVLEPSQAHNVAEDGIKRFGGSTDPSTPWPEEKSSTEDKEERFDRLELLLQKALRKATKRRNVGDNSLGSKNTVGSKSQATSGSKTKGDMSGASEDSLSLSDL